MRMTMVAMLILLLALPAGVWADEGDDNAGTLDVVVTTGAWSHYLGANGGVFHNKRVWQTDVFVVLPRGWYADFWHSAGLDGTGLSSDFGDEIDWTLGRVTPVGERWLVDASFSYYDVVALWSTADLGDVVRAKVALLRPDTVTFSASVEYYASTRGEKGLDNGLMLRAGIGHTIALHKRVVFTAGGEILWDDGAFGFDAGALVMTNGRLEWGIGERFSLLLPTITATTPLTQIDDPRTAKVVFGGGVRWEAF